MIKQLCGVTLASLLFASPAWSQFNNIFEDVQEAPIRFYLEPKVGFGSGGVKYTEGTNVSNSSSAMGIFASSIVGWYSNDVYFGLDLRYDNLMGAVDLNSKKEALNIFTAGLGFGYTFEYVPMRWYFSLDLQQRAWTASQSMGSGYQTGGYRIGLSYYLNESIILNADMGEPSYGEGSGASAKGLEAKVYGFSVSMPMDFERSKTPWKVRRGYTSSQKPDSAIKNLDIKDELSKPVEEDFSNDVSQEPPQTEPVAEAPATEEPSLVDEAIDDVADEKAQTSEPSEESATNEDFEEEITDDSAPAEASPQDEVTDDELEL